MTQSHSKPPEGTSARPHEPSSFNSKPQKAPINQIDELLDKIDQFEQVDKKSVLGVLKIAYDEETDWRKKASTAAKIISFKMDVD